MEMDELVFGIKKVDLTELREVKVKIPVRLLVNLHYVKLTESRPISDVVSEALTQYFTGHEATRGRRQNTGAPLPGTHPLYVEPRIVAGESTP